MPDALGRLRDRLSGHDDGDRQVVRILAAVLEDGLEAVEAACAEALANGACSADVVCSTSSPGIASRHRYRPSRRPRACSFAINRWPTVTATTV